MSLFWALSVYGVASPLVTSEGGSWLLMCGSHGFSNPASPCLLATCWQKGEACIMWKSDFCFRESLSPACIGHSGPTPTSFPASLGSLSQTLPPEFKIYEDFQRDSKLLNLQLERKKKAFLLLFSISA